MQQVLLVHFFAFILETESLTNWYLNIYLSSETSIFALVYLHFNLDHEIYKKKEKNEHWTLDNWTYTWYILLMFYTLRKFSGFCVVRGNKKIK